MKIIILLLIFKCILGLTEGYYTNCTSDAENMINPSTKRCRLYSPPEGFCCYLQYGEDDWYYYDDDPGDIIDGDTLNRNNENKIKSNSTKLRHLYEIDSDRYIGLTEDGYININAVEKEIQKLADDKIYIYCNNQNGLKLSLMFYCLILLFSLLLLKY